MADAFLIAHAVRAFQFEIGGAWWPVSIRDQMVRGRELVLRAARAGLISPSRPLLVVGAGAGGATAAVVSAQIGVRTELVDRALLPFDRQATCTTRWIDPTQYDWPAPHWDASAFPWSTLHPAMPFGWSADRSHMLALAWGRLLRIHAARLNGSSPGIFTFSPATVPAPRRPPRSTGAMLDVDLFSPSSGLRTVRVGMMLSARGFGSERVKADNHDAFEGWKFWDSDRLESPRLGVSAASKAPRVLISGGGDGALQDLLRARTGNKSTRDLLYSLSSVGGVLPALLSELFADEDQANRAYSWGTGASDDHWILDTLHERHRVFATDLLKLGGATLGAEIDALIGDPARQSVELAFPCTHFSKCYALNRFLVILIDEHLKRSSRRSVLRPGIEVAHVRSASSGHACVGPGTCLGIDHEVSFESRTDCRIKASGFLPSGIYDVIVLRHGVDPPTFLYGGRPIGPNRQLLPYHASR